MDIAIFGQHPEIKYGFNSTMTMNWIQALSSEQHNICLYIRKELEHTIPKKLSN